MMDKQNIETIYPLAPLQQAFLWHSLQTSAQAGLIHMRCTLHGALDSTLLKQAWELVMRQHPTLRTSVHWESVKQPLQVVARKAPLPWAELDYRDQSDLQSALGNFLAEDRDRSFDLTQPPISRLTLIQLSDTDYEMVWSCHHLMLDGWSGALVFNQVFEHYETLQQGKAPTLTTVPTYQTYIRWLKQQDAIAAATFWQKELAGFSRPTPLPVSFMPELGNGERGIGNREQGTAIVATQPPSDSAQGKPNYPNTPLPSFNLSGETTTALQTFLRSQRLTLNTLMQGVWALLLHTYSGEADVLFGATVSGRQGDLAGVEAIVGLLINVLPVRVKVAPENTVLDWLQGLQTQQATASRYAYASPDQIQSWSEVSGRLFDSLLVIENYPRTANTERSLQVDNVQSGLVSTYGLTVIIKPGDTLTVMLRSEAERFDEAVLATLLKQFQALLSAIAAHPQHPIGAILPSRELAVSTQATTLNPNAVAPMNLNRDKLEGSFFAPRNRLELQLTQIWETVLGVHPLSIEDSFFDLGGDSLLAVQLFNQMQQHLNCTLPLASLFQAPNIRKFAALLSQEQPTSQWSSLVPIQTSGSRTPLFFHGGSADALTWARFSHMLGTDRPFYALQRPDLDGSDVIHTTVEDLATACVKEMRMVQPQGPYLVGGHCLGGAVAFEIAQQLQAEGEEVISVVLIDAYRPEPLPTSSLVKLQTKLQFGVFWLRKNYYYHGGWEKLALLPSKVWQRFKPAKSTRSAATPALATNEPATRHGEAMAATNQTTVASSYEYRYARAQKANELAAERYMPKAYSGHLKLFRARIQILDWYFGSALGWQTVAKTPVEVTNIPGFFGNLFNHQSGPLLTEHVKHYLSTIA